MATDIGPRIGITGEKAFQDSIKAVNAQLKALDAQMQSVTAEFAKNADSEDALAAKNQVLGKSVDAAKQKLSLLDKQLANQKEKLTELGNALERAARESGENSAAAIKAQNAYNKQYRAVADLEQQYSKTTAKINEMTNAMESAGNEAGAVSTSLGTGNILAASAAWDGIKMAVSGVDAAIQDCIQTGMEFSASVSEVAATMGTTAEEIGDLRDFAKDMGATTAFTATEAAEALNYMALAGYSADESMQALPNVLNLAAAGGIALAQASDMITDAQSALGLSMEQSARMVDEMAMASTKTNTSVAQLGEAMLTVGGTAKYMAGGTTEISQVLGVLADSSIKGAEGGTKLRNIILSLTAPTKDAAATLDRLGVSIFDAEGNLREFSEIFPELNAAMSQMTDQKQLDALAKIFNSRDIAAAQALLGTTVDRWNELDTAIQGAAGSAERMAKTKLDNLAGDLTLLKSAADNAKIAFSDALEPAMRGTVKAATAVISVIGDIIEQNPVLAHTLAGITAGLGALVIGFAAYTVKIKLATEQTKKFLTTFAASPFGTAALAVGALTTVLVGLASAAAEAESASDSLRKSITENRDAYQDNRAELDEQRESILGMISTVEQLANAEEKTAAQKETLRSAIEELNSAVPNLNLAYNEQTDSLNMTTEALRELALAEHERAINAGIVERLNQAYIDQYEAEKNLETATREAADAQEEWNAAIAEWDEQDPGAEKRIADAVDALDKANTAVSDFNGMLAGLSLEIAALEVQYNANMEASKALSDATDEVGEAANGTGNLLEELTDRVKALAEESAALTDANDLLKASLDEQSESGSVSLDTALKLIDAGYAAALSVDEETGAVTVNRDAYIQLASAKMDEKIATLQAKLESAKAAEQLSTEAAVALHASSSYWNLSAAQLAAKAAADDNIASLETQIAALVQAKNSLGNFSDSAGAAARSGGAASKRIKTQAEKDLDTYKALRSELDHQRSMDEVSEADYYHRLRELRDSYLRDESNVAEYRKISEKLYQAEQDSLRDREKLREDYRDKVREINQSMIDLEENYKNQLEARTKEIASAYGLFDEIPERQRVSGGKLISNLQGQLQSMQSFYENLEALERRGAGDALTEEIRAMGVDAADELDAILRLTDQQLSQYSSLYEEKQALANKVAMEELEQLREETDAQLQKNMESIQELYDKNAPGLGMSFAESLADGIQSGIPEVEQQARVLAQAAIYSAQSVLENSTLFGGNPPLSINRDVEAMMAQSNKGITRDEAGNLLAGAVNAITMSRDSTPQPMNITIQTRDGREIARAFLPDIRAVSKESPEVKNDI